MPVHSAAPSSSQSMEDRFTLMEIEKRMSCEREFNAYLVQSAREAEKNIRNPIQNAYQRHVFLSRQRRNCSPQVPTAS